MVVLAMDVGADRAAHRDVAGPRGHRHEPAERQEHLHQPVQAHARVAHDEARLRVDGTDPVQRGHVEYGAARVLRRVAVRPPEPAGDAAARPHVRTAAAASVDVRGRSIREVVGAVRPQPVTDTKSALSMPLTV